MITLILYTIIYKCRSHQEMQTEALANDIRSGKIISYQSDRSFNRFITGVVFFLLKIQLRMDSKMENELKIKEFMNKNINLLTFSLRVHLAKQIM